LNQNQREHSLKAVTLEKNTPGGKSLHPTELIHRIQKGLRFSELKTLQETLDLPFEKLAAKLCISRSTLQRRKATGRLTPDESDKVIRYSRLVRQAADFFGDVEKARAWLKHPQYGLGGAVPLDYASTEAGAREVENLLGRMKYGVYS
jgi:putative toxin-antitoxin system antitoxin component (TIGR02293 family)